MPEETIGPLSSSPVITRHPQNPLLTQAEVPYESTLVFNAGVAKYQGRYVMVFRNDVFQEGANYTNLGLAFSDDGIGWEVEKKPCLTREQFGDDEVWRAYDPRLTVIEGRVAMCFAVDTRHGLRGGVAFTDDFERWEVQSLSVPDNRNMVLFPEQVGGKYARLERPFPVYSRGHKDRFDMWFSDSPDLLYWGNSRLVLGVEDLPFANDKIGPGAPPVKTERGWLTAIHTVDRDDSRGKNGWGDAKWPKRYCAGLALLDLAEPWKVVGLSTEPLIAPEAPYETEGGYRNDVIFPGGMILEDDGEVKIYYGAADTVECVATAAVDDLLSLCTPCEKVAGRAYPCTVGPEA